jgi:pyruvate kinase
MIQDTMKVVLDTGMANLSDAVTLVAGLPLNSPNMINTVRVLILGTVLARAGAGGFANPGMTRARGKVIIATTPKEAHHKMQSLDGEILICDVLTSDYTPILRIVEGVICEGVSEISEQQLRYTNPRLVWLTNVSDATKKIESGLTITIDAQQLLVYEGSI